MNMLEGDDVRPHSVCGIFLHGHVVSFPWHRIYFYHLSLMNAKPIHISQSNF